MRDSRRRPIRVRTLATEDLVNAGGGAFVRYGPTECPDCGYLGIFGGTCPNCGYTSRRIIPVGNP